MMKFFSSIFFVSILTVVVVAVLTLPPFFTNALIYKYDPKLTMTALTFAKTTYCNASEIRNWTCPSCPLNPNFEIVNVYHNLTDSFQAFIGYDPTLNMIAVNFRGTWNEIGWLVDFDTALIPVYPRWHCPGDARMHRGYMMMYEAARDAIFADLIRLVAKYPSAGIFTGSHSMGASLGQIFAMDAKVYFPKKRVVSITFGTPRTGNSLFSTCVANLFPPGDMVRITHKHDPIPMTPFRSSGYLHVPQETWFDNDLGPLNYTTLCPSETAIQESPNGINSVSIWEANPFDHLLYLGRSTRCNLQDPAVEEKILTEELSRDPSFQFAVRAKKRLMEGGEK